MNNINLSFSHEAQPCFTPKELHHFIEENPRSAFLHHHEIKGEMIDQILEQFSNKKHFVHVGIGGSNLGTQTLINALTYKAPITFLANLDSDEIYEELSKINLDDALFYIVSKSGETLETLGIFNIIISELKKTKPSINLKDHFVFCTDPQNGYLRRLAKQEDIHCLDLPFYIGGRFSVLTNVSYLPLAFCGINLDIIEKAQKDFLSELKNNPQDFIKLADIIYSKYGEGFSQTVLMPYSSKLKYLSLWFVQLWAESLGKDSKGFTPLFAYGSTDQHSQMQLFIDGPKDKLFILLEVEQSAHKLMINKELDHEKLNLIHQRSLNEVLNTQLQATFETFKEKSIPCVKISINKKSEETIVSLLLLFETLTSVMGIKMGIDPFNQPGVEHGKKKFIEIAKSRQS